MTTRKSPDINNYFSAAKQSQQLSEAEAEIQRLRTEIDELRNSGSTELEEQLSALRSQLQSQSGVNSIHIDQIQPNLEQPRQTFLSESIEYMSRSLARDGQLEPIILIGRANLMIFDGERRWRSAKALGWETLQAVIIPEPVALHRQALLTSLHREDLNALDKADAIVRELITNTGLEAQDIPRILATAVRRLHNQKRMNQVVELMSASLETQQLSLAELGLDDSERAVVGILLDLQLNPASINTNIFPMLSLPADLKAAIRESGITGVHAIALSKLHAKNLKLSESEALRIRIETTKKVIVEKLSASSTRKLVGEVIAQCFESLPLPPKKVKQLSQATASLQKISNEMLKSADPSQVIEFQKILHSLLAEVEVVLKPK